MIQCYGTVIVRYEDNQYTGLVMEYCSHYTLRYLIDFCKEKKTMLPMKSIALIFYCLSKGIFDLNNMGVVHRDIKPENVYITEANEIKLGDFGISESLPDGKTVQITSVAGTFNYMPPESFTDSLFLSSRTDVWGLGCILYELCTLEQLFHSPLEIIPFTNIKSKLEKIKLNEDVISILELSLAKEFNQRATILELTEKLNQNFFPRYLPPLQDCNRYNKCSDSATKFCNRFSE